MCVGMPLKVQHALDGDLVVCADEVGQRYPLPVQTALLDAPPRPGDWLLVHIDTAIRCLDDDEARQIAGALQAVQLAARGEDFEHLIADLVGREPQLPEHLRHAGRESRGPATLARYPQQSPGELHDV